VKKSINDIMQSVAERDYLTVDIGPDAPPQLTGLDLQAYIGQLEQRMRDAAANLEFEDAARIRDEIRRLEDGELGIGMGRATEQRRQEARGALWKPSRSRAEKAAEAKARSRRRVGK
jgi:excinuclease ABC subunit B